MVRRNGHLFAVDAKGDASRGGSQVCHAPILHFVKAKGRSCLVLDHSRWANRVQTWTVRGFVAL